VELKHLEQLRDDHAYEEQSLEFKADVDFKQEPAIAEFLRDVSSIANADGGDLIIGMAEDDQGRAEQLRPTKYSDLEDLENRIRQYCENHIDPPLVSLRFHAVKLASSGHAVVLRIDQGWAGPHMVTFKDEHRYFVRRGRSKSLSEKDPIAIGSRPVSREHKKYRARCATNA
jgi:predicted HTH transcriptional regulator